MVRPTWLKHMVNGVRKVVIPKTLAEAVYLDDAMEQTAKDALAEMKDAFGGFLKKDGDASDVAVSFDETGADGEPMNPGDTLRQLFGKLSLLAQRMKEGAFAVFGTGSGDIARGDHTHTVAEVGAAAANHTHTAAQVGAAATSHTHTAAQVGAAATDHTHTAAQVGAAAASHTHTAAQVGAAAATHTHTPASIGAAATSHTHAASAINSGALGVPYGGTGGTTELALKQKVGTAYNATNYVEHAYAASFRPYPTEAVSCGHGSNRWTTVYSVNAANVSSDRRLKTDIREIVKARELIMAIAPVQFKRTNTTDKERLHYGFIAQEVREVTDCLGIEQPALWSRDSIDEDLEGKDATEDQVRYGMSYEELIAPLVAMAQLQQRQIEQLQEQVAELQARVGEYRASKGAFSTKGSG